MVLFDLWGQAVAFFAIYSVIIIVPCILVGIIGYRVITDLGKNPTQAPAIQMSIVYKLIIIEVVTFYMLISVYFYFSN